MSFRVKRRVPTVKMTYPPGLIFTHASNLHDIQLNYPAASWRGISNQVCFYLIAARAAGN